MRLCGGWWDMHCALQVRKYWAIQHLHHCESQTRSLVDYWVGDQAGAYYCICRILKAHAWMESFIISKKRKGMKN